jgi:hypothetical protein
MKNVCEEYIFWDITLCSLLKVNQRFMGTLLPSLVLKNKPSKIPAESRWQAEQNWLGREAGGKFQLANCDACSLLSAGILLGLFFNPEGGTDMFLQNVCRFSTDCMALESGKLCSS